MEPKERLKAAQELIKAYEALKLKDDHVIVIRLFAEAASDDFTVRRKCLD